MAHDRMSATERLAPLARAVLVFLAVCAQSHVVLAQSKKPSAQPSPSPDNSATEQSDQPKPEANQPKPEADQSKPEVRDPIENADEFKSKLTLGIYFTPGARAYDLNLRHQFGPVTAWIAGFYDPKSSKLLRVGAQYDYKKGWLHLVPTLEVSTTRAMSGSLYSELGSGKTYAIAGIART